MADVEETSGPFISLPVRGASIAAAVGFIAFNIYNVLHAASPLYYFMFVPPVVAIVSVLGLGRPNRAALRAAQAGLILTAASAALSGTVFVVEPILFESRGTSSLGLVLFGATVLMVGMLSDAKVLSRLWDHEMDGVDANRVGTVEAADLRVDRWSDDGEKVLDLSADETAPEGQETDAKAGVGIGDSYGR